MIDPSSIPAHLFPLPEGSVLLGTGDMFRNDDAFAGWCIHPTDTSDHWVPVTRGSGRNVLAWAVLMDHPLVDANRELVASLNPSVVFPWMEIPALAREFHLIPQDHRIRRSLPTGQVIIGRADDIEWPVDVDTTGVIYTTFVGAWVRLTRPTSQDIGVVAAVEGHPLLALNAELVAFNNPVPAAPAFIPQQPLPEELPPVPEGCVLLGWGSYEIGQDDSNGFILRGVSRFEQGQTIRWHNGHWSTTDNNCCFAYPSDSAIARRNPEVVAYYQQLLSTQGITPPTVAPTPSFSPLPPDLPPAPEGLVIVGWGDAYERSQRSSRLAFWNEYSGWSRVYENDILTVGSNQEIHAYSPDSPVALAMPEAVAFYNPSMTTPSTPALPSWAPPVPAGYVFLGQGGAFTPLPRRDPAMMMVTESSPAWRTSSLGGYTGTDTLGYYAVPAGHPMAPAYSVPAPVGAIPLESWMPPLPSGAVYLGRGGSFRRERNFDGWAITQDGRGWRNSDNWSGRDDENYYAAPADSDVARLNASSAPAVVEQSTLPYGKRLWILTLNGAPVASLEELRVLCEPLIFKPENLDAVTDCLWRALEYDDPESRLGDWATKEPVLLMVDFLPDRRGDDALIPTVVESSKTIGEIITTAAAGVLLRGGLSNHFHYTEEGRLVINPESPPSIDQGCEILRRTLEVRETGQKLDNYSAWTLGMLGDELERFFGDAFDPSLVMEATGRAYNTYITSLKVYRELWANRRNLSFTHHKEALYAKVAPEDTTFILDTADRLRLSVAQQRKLTSFVRLYGSSSFAEEPPDDAEALMERLEVKSVNKNYLFFLRSENKWFRYRGPFEHIPNGASPIINADTRAMLDSTGQPTEMAEWTPVGVEIPYVRGHSATLEAHRAEALPGDDEVLPSQGGNTDRLDSVDEERVTNPLLVQAIVEANPGIPIFTDTALAPSTATPLTNAELDRVYAELIVGEGVMEMSTVASTQDEPPDQNPQSAEEARLQGIS